MVMPETGLVPTMAMARAATEVKRKLITKTVTMAIRPSRSGCGIGLSTEKLKNTQMTSAVNASPRMTYFMLRSVWVLGVFSSPAAGFAEHLFEAHAEGLDDDL